MDEKDAWIARFLGLRPDRSISPDSGLAERDMAEWNARLKDVITTLKAVGRALRGMEPHFAEPAIVELLSLMANLASIPDTARKVDELARYLETDDIMDDIEEPNGFGIEVRVRGELLPVLKRAQLARRVASRLMVAK